MWIRPLSIKRNWTCTYKPSHKENTRLVVLTGEFYQTFEEELILVLYKFFEKIKEEETFFNLLHDASITPIQNSEKHITRRENYTQIFLIKYM